MNEIVIDKINSYIELVKMPLKSFNSNTTCVVGGVLAELLKSGTENLYEFFKLYVRMTLHL